MLEFSAAMFPPPYVAEQPLPTHAREVSIGTLVILDLDTPPRTETERRRLAQVVARYRRNLAVAVFLRLPRQELAGRPQLIARIRAGGFQTILTDDHDVARLAWQMLPRPRDLGREWVEWLGLHREVSAPAARIIRTVTSAAPRTRA